VTSNYLQRNPEFLKEWVLQNVKPETLEAWLSESQGPSISIRSHYKNNYRPSTEVSKGSFYKLSTIDKHLSSRNSGKSDVLSKDRLSSMSERELFLELIKNIANELDVDRLCHKIIANVALLTKSDRGSLFLHRRINGSNYVVSKLFDVSPYTSFEESIHSEETEIKIPFGKGIAGTVALTKQAINIKNAYEDPRFNKEIDARTGYRTQSLLCMPILNYDGELMGVAQIMNKTDGSPYSSQDEEIFAGFLSFCGIGLTNAQLFEMSCEEYKRNQMLLQLARNIFAEQSNLDALVQKIMVDGQSVLQCERCSIFLMNHVENAFDEDLAKKHTESVKEAKKTSPAVTNPDFVKAFELHDDKKGSVITPGLHELQNAKNAELAREVVSTGQVINIMDAIADPRFGKELVSHDGFRIRSILSVPIRNAKKDVIGVVQFMNKLNGRPFTEGDAQIVEAFAIFAGLGVYNCQMYENVCIMMAKQTVALEVLSYHATAGQEDTDKLMTEEIPDRDHYELCKYEFDDDWMKDDDTVKATVRMFMDMDIMEKFKVPYDVLCRWTLSVKKNYRPVTYHNWRHAFNVAQTMFVMLFEAKLRVNFDSLEMFGLVVACLCHDLDHRGTNNTFQSKSDSPLALLYGTSTMEHHHFDQCIMILSSDGNNIFKSLSSADYRKVIKIVESAILSTDLALYFRKKGAFQKLVESGETDWSSEINKELLRGMMMTACDVSAITKPWEVQQRVAHLVAAEFFEQGDLERQKLGHEPIAMMDRHKAAELPKMQVGFIDAICTPVYKMLADLDSHFHPLYDGCMDNRTNWNGLADLAKNGDIPDSSLKHAAKGTSTASKMSTAQSDDKNNNKGSSVDKGKSRNSKLSSNGSDHKHIPPRASKSRTCTLL